MLRYVNTDVLIELKITAHQFIILTMVIDKQYDHLEKYLIESNSLDSFPDDLDRLSKQFLIVFNRNKPQDYKSIVAQPEFLRTLYKDDIFEELYSIFPIKVQRPDGSQAYLRREKRLCKDLYYVITKDDRNKHEHILKCLRFELEYREENGSMQYLKTLQKWLSGREWENFEDLVADGSLLKKRAETYGTQLE